jgi:pimeloyl-ACP methyl ester carboxylesterase
MGTLFIAPVISDFIRYIIWRFTTKTQIIKGYASANGADIHFVSYGGGHPVLLLHGGLSNRLSWFAQIPWLVKTGYQVIVPDTRGHGLSGLGDDELTYHLLASDAISVLDKLNINQTTVIGWSDGGNTALLMGLFWRKRVNRIIAISANFNPTGLIPEARNDKIEPSSGVVYWFRRLWTGAGERIHTLEGRIKRMWQRHPKLKPDDLGQIETPTLVIVGKRDIVTIEHALQMAARIKNGTIAIVPGGHFTPITQAPRVNRLIAEFLEISTISGKISF